MSAWAVACFAATPMTLHLKRSATSPTTASRPAFERSRCRQTIRVESAKRASWIVRGFALPGIGLALQRQEGGQNLAATLGVLDIDVRPGADRLLPVPHRLDPGLADAGEQDALRLGAGVGHALRGFQRDRDVVDRKGGLMRPARDDRVVAIVLERLVYCGDRASFASRKLDRLD